MKKFVEVFLVVITILCVLIGCENKNIKEEKNTQESIEKENSVKEESKVVKEEMLDGSQVNVINRPNGDYSLQFGATIINNKDYGNVLRLTYRVSNISFVAEFKDEQGNITETKEVCCVDAYDKNAIQVIDSSGNVLNPWTSGYEDEIIAANEVYIGTTGNFAQTYHINDNVDMSNITILFVPTMTKFNVNITQ